MAECIRKKHRSAEEKKNLTKRLNIIEGQVRGVKDLSYQQIFKKSWYRNAQKSFTNLYSG